MLDVNYDTYVSQKVQKKCIYTTNFSEAISILDIIGSMGNSAILRPSCCKDI